tara:strand:+ start:8512 stop:8865 length:354 start_codon:yes stop_codon:yes gene_type:complete
MKKLHTIISTLVISATLAGAVFAVQAKETVNDAVAAKSANITMEHAINIALSTVPGTVVKAEFDSEKGQTFWEVEVVDINQQTIDLEIDSNTGAVIKQQVDMADHEDEEIEEEDYVH